MSLTKGKISDMITKALEGGQIPSYRKIERRSVFERIETVRNMMMEKQIQQFGDLDGEFVTQYQNVEVLCQEETNQKYSILPSRLISFGEWSGLRQISPMKKQTDSFIKVANGFQRMMAHIPAGKLHGHTGYYLERVKIGTNQSIRVFYQNISTDYDKVLIKMIASTYDFDENEALPIPALFEEALIMAVGQAFDKQFQLPQDIKEDLSPKKSELQ